MHDERAILVRAKTKRMAMAAIMTAMIMPAVAPKSLLPT